MDRFLTSIGAVTVTEYFQKSSVQGSPTPQGFRYAIEIRNRGLGGLEHQKALESIRLADVFAR